MKLSLYHFVGRRGPELTPLQRRVILDYAELMQTVCHLGSNINIMYFNYLYDFYAVLQQDH
jgi:hypothetical protein